MGTVVTRVSRRGPRGAFARIAVLLFSVMPLMAAVVLYSSGAGASTPSSGTIGPAPDPASVTWTGPAATAVTNGPGACQDIGAFCDTFLLTVDVDPTYWDTHIGGADIAISWAVGANDFDLYLYRNTDCTNEIDHSTGGAPGTSEDVFLPDASGDYCVLVVYFSTVEADYGGTATFVSEAGGGTGGVVFDDTTVAFGPSTIVSAHWLGAEPQTTIERVVPGSDPGATDPNRVFVDWPLSSRAQTGQLSRSMDGGKTFRLLYDPACAERSRPMCATSGGGDTEDEVNLINGHVMFADQEVLLNEAYAHSDDHGDSFLTQQVITNGATGVDRQWLAATDNSFSVDGFTIEGFLTYHVPLVGQYIQGIDAGTGAVLPQPVPQINIGIQAEVEQSGQLRVDNNPASPGYQWIYQPFNAPDGTTVGTAFGPDYVDPLNWETHVAGPEIADSFPWLAIDAAGNAYATWDSGASVYYSFSDISSKDNNPALGGRPGTTWSDPVELTPPEVGSAVFPEVIAGDAGTIAVVFIGTTQYTGTTDDAPDDVLWDTYAVIVRNALQQGGPAVASVGLVNHRPVHQGNICTSGTTCLLTGKDRSLLDMIDVSVFQDGAIGVVYMDNYSTFAQPVPAGPDEDASPFTHFAELTEGPLLYNLRPGAPGTPLGPGTSVVDASSDATWPNVSGAANLPALDITKVLVQLDRRGKAFHGSIALKDAKIASMQRDLAAYNAFFQSTPPAERLQYILRLSTGTEVYHLSMEVLADGTTRFFGGKLDANDQIINPTSLAVVGAAYNTDASFTVTGAIKKNVIQLSIPTSLLGVGTGTPVYSVTAFAVAGPTEALDNILNPMRTVDASPAFDAVL